MIMTLFLVGYNSYVTTIFIFTYHIFIVGLLHSPNLSSIFFLVYI